MHGHEGVNSRRERHIMEREGDVFDSPKDSILIHACNCQGAWGAGIAKAFRMKYPRAFEVYKKHCTSAPGTDHAEILGTCLLISPEVQSEAASGSQRRSTNRESHWIACLFTSVGYGKKTARKPGTDPPEKILQSTRRALDDLEKQLQQLRNELGSGDKTKGESARHSLGEIYSCRINSGYFGVDWEETKEVFETVFGTAEHDGEEFKVTILGPPVKEEEESHAPSSRKRRRISKPS